MEVALLNQTGKKVGGIKLPDIAFTAPVNEVLLAQAVRVYQTNRRQGNAFTKTRGEVRGSGRKIWRQKGTGRARHGDRYAPIFVGGGRAHGPKTKSWSLKLSRKMKRWALASALSVKADQGLVLVVEKLEFPEVKTKRMKDFLTAVLPQGPESALLVVPRPDPNLYLAARNLKEVQVLPVDQVNALAVLQSKWLIVVKEAVERLTARIIATQTLSQPEAATPPPGQARNRQATKDKQVMKSVDEIGLNQRIVSSLKAANIKTTEKLRNLTKKELAEIKGIGPKAIEEIGLRLKN